MPDSIVDGTGTQFQAYVDNTNRLHTRSISRSEAQDAAACERSYNINTGTITITGSSVSALIYIKNNESLQLAISSVVLGVGDATVSDVGELVIIRNPTGGDIISDATPVDQNQNRNFGSPETLTADTFKGKDGGTVSGGDDLGLFFAKDNDRLFAPIDLVLERGSTLAVTYNPLLSSGTVKVYVALLVHLIPSAAAQP